MKQYNRDLWVMAGKEVLTEKALAQQVEIIHQLLYTVETPEQFCVANEVIDVNRGKIIQKPHLIQKAARFQRLPHFVFLFNKN